MYIVPVVIFMLLQSATNLESGGGSGGGGGGSGGGNGGGGGGAVSQRWCWNFSRNEINLDAYIIIHILWISYNLFKIKNVFSKQYSIK